MQTRDTQALDDALAVTTASISLGGTVPSRPRRQSSVEAGPSKAALVAYDSAQALDRLNTLFAQFGAVESALSDTTGMNPPQLTGCFRSADLHRIDPARTSEQVFRPDIVGRIRTRSGRVGRRQNRARRLCSCLQNDRKSSPAGGSSAQRWPRYRSVRSKSPLGFRSIRGYWSCCQAHRDGAL